MQVKRCWAKTKAGRRCSKEAVGERVVAFSSVKTGKLYSAIPACAVHMKQARVRAYVSARGVGR